MAYESRLQLRAPLALGSAFYKTAAGVNSQGKQATSYLFSDIYRKFD